MSLILQCRDEEQNYLFLYKLVLEKGSKYWANINGVETDQVDSFTKLIRILKFEEVKLNKFIRIEGEPNYLKAFKIAQQGEYSYYNAKERIVDICQRLLKGERINTERDAITYGVHMETLKLDIYTLRNILTDYTIDFDGDYKLNFTRGLSIAEAFVLLIMLYHSKSLNSAEVKQIQEKIVKQFSGQEQQSLSKFFQSYSFYYKPYMEQPQLAYIELIFRAVSEQRFVTFTYQKKSGDIFQKTVKPLTVILHDRLYYLVAEDITEADEQPVNFRFDRMTNLNLCKDKYKIDEQNRFQQGQYIDEAFNMYTGKKETIRFKVKQHLVEYVMRRFPQARCVSEDEQCKTYDVIVRGTDGVILWLLSQKADLEVLAPLYLREKMKDIISDMMDIYR